MVEELKQCTNKKTPERACWKWKPIVEFRKRSDGSAYNQCKECLNNSTKIWRQSDQGHIKQKEYYDINKEELNAINREYHKEHKEEIRARKQKYNKENNEQIKDLRKYNYDNNKEEILNYYKEYNTKPEVKLKRHKYYEENKEEIKVWQKEYKTKPEIKKKNSEKTKERRINDPAWAFRKDASCMAYQRLKRIGASKNGQNSSIYFPWTDQELYNHITSLFYHPDNLIDGKVWMTWNNRGKYDPLTYKDDDSLTWTWQIDHIKADFQFHYLSITDKEFVECWSLDNLRPLRSDINNKENHGRSEETITNIKQSIREFLETYRK